MKLVTKSATRALAVGAAGFVLPGVPAAGDVTESYYNGPDQWNFQRTGIPDLDQRRQGLPNDGNCHCVPTCTMSLLIYAANHGFPDVAPGLGMGTYLEVTSDINSLAGVSYMDICYGEGEAGEPGDCPETYCDGNGDCKDGCGSTSAEQANEGIRDWLKFASNGADEKFTLSYWLASDEPGHDLRLKHLFALSFLEGAPLMRVNYGRYELVGFYDGIYPAYRRRGGHAMSFTGCRSIDEDEKYLFVRDPSTADGDLAVQSPYTTDQWAVSDELVLVTKQKEPPVTEVDTQYLAYLGTTDDDELMLLDVVAWIAPKKGYTFTSGLLYVLVIPGSGFGTELSGPTETPISGGSVVDVVLDATGLGCVALVYPEVGLPQVRYVQRLLGEDNLIAEVGGAVAVATGRQHDLYVVSDGSGGAGVTRRFTAVPQGDLGEYEESSDILVLPYALHGATFDDETDELVMVSTTGAKLVRAPRNLGSEVDPVLAWDIPTSVPMNGMASIAVEPGQGRTWLATSASHGLYGLTDDGSGQLQVETISRPDIENPTSVAFDDGGRLYVKAAAGAIVLKREASGLWQRDEAAEAPFDDVVLGEAIFVDRSRNNFDPDEHHAEEWGYHIPPSELQSLGTPVPDCPGDLDGDGIVGVLDFLAVLGAWGGSGGDVTGDGTTDVLDFLAVLANWGPCR